MDADRSPVNPIAVSQSGRVPGQFGVHVDLAWVLLLVIRVEPLQVRAAVPVAAVLVVVVEELSTIVADAFLVIFEVRSYLIMASRFLRFECVEPLAPQFRIVL